MDIPTYQKLRLHAKQILLKLQVCSPSVQRSSKQISAILISIYDRVIPPLEELVFSFEAATAASTGPFRCVDPTSSGGRDRTGRRIPFSFHICTSSKQQQRSPRLLSFYRLD